MNDGLSRIMQLKDVAIETSPTAQLILDNDGLLLIVNKAARNLFSMNEIALGSPFHDLELSYKPVELRSLIRKSLDERKSTKLDAVKFQSADGTGSVLSVSVVPLLHNGNILGVSISFFDMTAIESLQNEFEKSSQELETVNEELQSAQEELETTNEELQSTNEELETTNEELQSTNEELETMNEELQSTNEELETINNELRSMSGDLNTSNDLLSGILASLDAAVIALGPDCEILLWNDKAVDFWGVRPEEVQGKSIFGLDIGLPVEKLKKPISSFLKSKEGSLELPLAVTNRRGKKINCKVKLTRLADSKNGLVLLVHQLVD
ncbi:MAG: PAS domain S-box protein, partial [Candidatus Obscuribacterales bacterium]|nr:PAS domain S-box protein [Candidatus Obscuribacterales bacterium]